MRGRVLIVAGSDSGGGAGIQGDIKTVTALQGYAATAITALTAQNTQGVHGIVGIEPDFVARQMRVVLEDIGADCIKTGMLFNSRIVAAVVQVIEDLAPGVPLVIDPVMVAKGGQTLLDDPARHAIVDGLLPLATLVTPNAPEATALTGIQIDGPDSQLAAAQAMRAQGCRAVLLKGGHLPGPRIVDLLVTDAGTTALESPRIETRHTHGTGCTLASAIATGIAQGMDLPQAVRRARDYVHRAIATAPGYGAGHGPLNHAIFDTGSGADD
ncbi:MAG: bifunctional hydroxymethylpyrimidine kinase/phosphomethylpyrimidine kinase [Alphaproteobacteria bacterium]